MAPWVRLVDMMSSDGALRSAPWLRRGPTQRQGRREARPHRHDPPRAGLHGAGRGRHCACAMMRLYSSAAAAAA